MTSDPEPGCSQVVDLLADYLEEKLPPAVQHDLDRHLLTCPSCVSHLRTYRATVSLLRGLRDEELPQDLRDTARAFLAARTSH